MDPVDPMDPVDDSGTRELLEVAVELARGAGEVVRGFTGTDRRDVSVSAKATATDLVTAADRASEQWLLDRLAELRPDDAVLGEEGGRRAGVSDVRWLLDPIDGTVNFVLGLPQYAVSVAAEVAGRTVAGAVFNPVTAELWQARVGHGAFLDGRRLAGPRPVPMARAVVGTGFGYAAQRRADQATVIATLLPRVADIRRLGSASLDLCAVAAGRLDAYFESGLNPWDYAAGLLIATEAGCRATGLRGRPPEPRFVAVAGEGAATALFALLEELGADVVP
jgi:myo-inositol-1(or 4)-monophosphatase